MRLDHVREHCVRYCGMFSRSYECDHFSIREDRHTAGQLTLREYFSRRSEVTYSYVCTQILWCSYCTLLAPSSHSSIELQARLIPWRILLKTSTPGCDMPIERVLPIRSVQACSLPSGYSELARVKYVALLLIDTSLRTAVINTVLDLEQTRDAVILLILLKSCSTSHQYM